MTKRLHGLKLAIIGLKHFGNPIPKEWYAAAHELLEAIDEIEPTDKPIVGHEETPPLPEPIDLIWPSPNSHALGCGVEDNGIHDRYEAAEYGWHQGAERVAECIPEKIYTDEQMIQYGQECIAQERAKHEAQRLRQSHDGSVVGLCLIDVQTGKPYLADFGDSFRPVERQDDLQRIIDHCGWSPFAPVIVELVAKGKA